METIRENIRELEWANLGSWTATLASLLPLWLLMLAFVYWGIVGFILAIAFSVILLWKIWMTPELVLYSFFLPLMFLFIFEEVYISYKIPFTLLCALVLTIGIIGYQRSLLRSVTLAWFILLLVAIAAWALASHANQNYWQFACISGCFECSPGAPNCPATGELTSWWVLFFRP